MLHGPQTRMAASTLLIAALVAGEPAFGIEGQTLRVGYASNSAPLSMGKGVDARGILPDLMQTIVAERLGVMLESRVLPWAEAQGAVYAGEIDALVTFASAKRLETMYASRTTVFTQQFRAFVRAGSMTERRLRANPEVDQLAAERGCWSRGDGWQKSFLSKHRIAYDEGENVIHCLKRIDRSRSGFILLGTAFGRHIVRLEGLRGRIVMVPHVYDSVPFNLLVSKQYPVATALLEAFDEELRRMQADGSHERLVDTLRERDY